MWRRASIPVRRSRLLLLVLVAIGPLLVSPLAGPLLAGTPSLFVNFVEPVGVAAAFTPGASTKTGWYVTRFTQKRGQTRDLFRVDQFGNVNAVATLPSRLGQFEEYVAVTPGLGSYAGARSFIYVTQGPNIIEWSGQPTDPMRLFAVINSLAQSGNGIAFSLYHPSDPTFGGDMLVAGVANSGEVWRVRRETSAAACSALGLTAPCGVPTRVAHLPSPIGGPISVVPPTFAKCPGGGVLVTSKLVSGGAVFCVKSDGTILGPIGLWPGARGAHFIPPAPFSCAAPGVDRFFVTSIFRSGAGNLTQFPTTDFAGHDGVAALITSGTGAGIGLLNAASPSPPSTLSTFQSPIGEHRGSDFCFRKLERIRVQEPGEDGKVGVIVLSRAGSASDPGFQPGKETNPSTCRFGRIGNENSFVGFQFIPDQNGDGISDLLLFFNLAATGFGAGNNVHSGILTCLVFPNSPDEGFAGGE